MPPKKAPAATSKKTEVKKKEKVIEDKTFGLKNKKGAKGQKFVALVEKQVKSGGVHPLQTNDKKKEEKEKKKLEQLEMNQLFRPVIVQKALDPNVDPKSILCAFFKQGQCTKGDKCKFSHDVSVERRSEKKSIYADVREPEPEETMEDWDENKLKEVVEKKHAAEKKNATTIICKYFLEVVEKSLYGWFWVCPNGGEKCMYRHALPAGYVLKKDKKREDKKDQISIEELVERERAALGENTTKVTLETFLAWKKRKIEEKKLAKQEEEKKKLKDFKQGRQFGISGREMFSFNPDLVNDGNMDDDEQAMDIIREDNEDDGGTVRELDFSYFNSNMKDVDGTGTIADSDRFARVNAVQPPEEENASGVDNTGPINENLFLDEDLDGLDEELNDLDLEDSDEDDSNENSKAS